MDLGKSLTYYFEDPHWVKKILIGAGVFILSTFLSVILVGLLGYLILIGYSLDTLRNVRNGKPNPMPEWKDHWGEWLVKGVGMTIAVFVWSLPAIIIGILAIVPAALTGSSSDFWITMGGLGIVCFSCLSALWWIVVFLALPGISIRVSETEIETREETAQSYMTPAGPVEGENTQTFHKYHFGAGLAFGDIIAFTRQHFGEVIVVSIVYVVVAVALGVLGNIIGILLCGIGFFVAVPIATWITCLIQAHLYAQVGMGRGTHLATTDETAVSPAPEPAPVMVTAPVVEPETTAPAVQPDDQAPAPESE